jgi:drug/metabolite transporter (DMT)-like permease
MPSSPTPRDQTEEKPGVAKLARPDVLRGGLLMLVVASTMAVDTALIRLVATELHAFEIAFFRTLFSLALVVPWLWRSGLGAMRSPRMSLHLLRAAIKLAAMTAFFYAVSVMPLADVTAIIFTTPLFVAIGAMLFLGEVVSLRRGLAIATGFVGVLILLRPGAGVLQAHVLLALASAVGLAAIAVILKFLARHEPAHALVGLNLLFMVPLALLVALPVWVSPSYWALFILAAQGALAAMGQAAFARAMALADASILMPVDFVRLPLVVLIAYLAFGETADLGVWLGAAVIFGSAFYLVRSGAATST